MSQPERSTSQDGSSPHEESTRADESTRRAHREKRGPSRQIDQALQDSRAMERTTPPPEVNEVRTLPPRQQIAAVAIIAGRSFDAAAKAAGVSRQSVYNWRRNDPAFRATIDHFQANALQSARSRLVSLADQAVTTVGISMARGNSSVAMNLLKQLSVFSDKLPEPCDLVDAAIAHHDRRSREIIHRNNKLKDFQGYGRDMTPYQKFQNETFVEQAPPDGGKNAPLPEKGPKKAG